MLQDCVSVRFGQAEPPFSGAVVMVLLWLRTPEPQERLHVPKGSQTQREREVALQAVQAETTQLTGQGWDRPFRRFGQRL